MHTTIRVIPSPNVQHARYPIVEAERTVLLVVTVADSRSRILDFQHSTRRVLGCRDSSPWRNALPRDVP
eukprot:COSAG06_NODE_32753_length_500_cov_47.478803_1_plen_68_part_10